MTNALPAAVDLSAERASELIGGIHDCALDPALWPATLDRIRLELDFSTATLDVVALPSFAPILSVTAGAPGRQPARRIIACPLGESVVHTQPSGQTALTIGFAREETMLGCLGMGRHEHAAAVGDRELRVLRFVAPHVRRAVSIGKLLARQASQAQSFAASLDAVTAGIVLVDRDMRVLHANRAATGMIRAEDAILTRNGILRCAAPDANARLQAAISAASGNDAAIGHRGIGIPVRARSTNPAVAHVLPLRGSEARPGLAPRAVAAVFLAHGADPAPLPRAALAALYDLTPAEARIMELIADGCTVAEAGRTVGIALSTAKTHLQRVFSKTGCRRQVELANLARSLRQPG